MSSYVQHIISRGGTAQETEIGDRNESTHPRMRTQIK